MLAGWFCLLAGGLTWSIGWWAYPVLWLFPVYAFMFLGDNFRSFAEHSHPENDHAADEHRLITYTSNPVERMFVAPMNMNFHTAHHLWPSIPYYNLPIADSEIRRLPESSGLEWRILISAICFPTGMPCPLRSAAKEDDVDGRPPMPTAAPEEFRKHGSPLITTEAVPVCPVCGGLQQTEYASGFDY